MSLLPSVINTTTVFQQDSIASRTAFAKKQTTGAVERQQRLLSHGKAQSVRNDLKGETMARRAVFGYGRASSKGTQFRVKLTLKTTSKHVWSGYIDHPTGSTPVSLLIFSLRVVPGHTSLDISVCLGRLTVLQVRHLGTS